MTTHELAGLLSVAVVRVEILEVPPDGWDSLCRDLVRRRPERVFVDVKFARRIELGDRPRELLDHVARYSLISKVRQVADSHG